MTRRVGAWVGALIVVLMLASVALAIPDCDKAPKSRWCRATTTTTKPPSTTITTATTTISSSTTTTNPTTTAPTTTSTTVATTSTTTAPTTTSSTAETTTTTTGDSGVINLNGDWAVAGHSELSGFTVNGNGHQILVTGTVDWDDFTIDNVTRVMFHNGAGPSELTNGVVSDSGVTNQLGFYPLHWHLNGDTTQGTLVDNVTIRDSHFRGFVPHGSHGITIRNSSCLNLLGECVWWDETGTNPGISDQTNDLLLDSMFADGIFWPKSIDPCCAIHHRISAFMLGSGTNMTIRNSHCQNVVGGVDASCYQWPEHSNDETNVWTFHDNTAAGPSHGIFVWQNDSSPHLIERFTGGGIDHGAYVNLYTYRDVDVPYTFINAVGRDGGIVVFEDSDLGHVRIHDHALPGRLVLENIVVDSFTLADAGEEPATILITGINLACGGIVYEDAHPQTRVFIDGVEC